MEGRREEDQAAGEGRRLRDLKPGDQAEVFGEIETIREVEVRPLHGHNLEICEIPLSPSRLFDLLQERQT